MALNEDSLEAMMDGRDGEKPPKAVKTAATEEFEVYERATPRDKMTDKPLDVPPPKPADAAVDVTGPIAQATLPTPEPQPEVAFEVPAELAEDPAMAETSPEPTPRVEPEIAPAMAEPEAPTAELSPPETVVAPEPPPPMEPEAIEPTDPAALPPAPAAREARALPPVPEELMLEPEAPAEAPTSEAAMPEEVEAPGDRVEQDPAPVEETGPPEDETAAMEQEPAPAVAAASAHTRSTRLMESAPAFEVKTPRLRPMSSTPARKPELDEEREVYNHGSVRSTGAGAGGCHVAIVQSDYNHEITDMMAEWAKRQGEKMEADITAHVHVPGVFDTPLAVQTLMRRDDVDAVVVLGCVVQGETGHDEVITHAVAAKLLQLALDHGKPLGFGVTGPRMTWAQAEARVGVGKQAMESAVAQWRLAQG